MLDRAVPILMAIVSIILFMILQNIFKATDVQGFIFISTIVICFNIWGVAEYIISKINKK